MFQGEPENVIRCPASAGRRFVFAMMVIALLGLITASAVLQNSEFAWGALLPGVIVFALLFSRPANLNARMTDSGIEFEESDRTILYSDIQGLLLAGACQDPSGKLRSGSVTIFHKNGSEVFPKSIQPDPETLYSQLLSLIDLPDGPPQSDTLKTFYSQQVAMFGSEQVWAFNPREFIVPRDVSGVMKIMWAALVVVGISWMIHSGSRPDLTYWLPLGIGLLIVSFIGFLACFARNSSASFGIPNWKQSGIVISPGGIAMVQGTHKGVLKWEELRNVHFGKQRFVSGHQIRNIRAIQMQVAGAEIPVADIYDRPLAIIHEQIVGYWKEPEGS